MADDASLHEIPTRRDCVKYGGAVIGGGLLAGCAGESDAGSAADDASTPEDEQYSVTMAPAGRVTFDSVPETVFARQPHHAGMAVAVGHGDGINALHAGGYYGVIWNKFLERLDGVSVDWADLTSSTEFEKETLYSLDSDVHLVDPAVVAGMDNWSTDDIEEVADEIGPWIGNAYSLDHTEPPAQYADDYQYYTLWDLFTKVAGVFRESERAAKLKAVHTELLSTIEAGRPPESDRPTAAMVLFSGTFEDMWGYTMNEPGIYRAHTRPLGATDAYAAAGMDVGDSAKLDAEALLEADPDILLVLGGMAEGKDMGKTRDHLENHAVLQELTAVRNGRVHTQGGRVQGPLVNLFQLEMTAKQLYPEAFGEWPTYVDGPYPEIPEDEQLFDRQRVANIINGEI